MIETNAGEALTPNALARVAWHVSTRSASTGGNCVQAGPLADGSGRVAVRHSRHPHNQVVVYSDDEWAAFLTHVKHGAFDRSA